MSDVENWTDDLTKCKSCPETYKEPAKHYAFPLLASGGNSEKPWPLCEHCAWPMAAIAGWKPVTIEEYERKNK